MNIMQKRKRTPQEKKQLSYSRDRRKPRTNSNKGPRKGVPHRKALSRRAVRRSDKTALAKASGAEDFEVIDGARRSHEIKRWRKWPGKPLSEHVAEQAWCRASRTGRKQNAKLQHLLLRLQRAEQEGHDVIAVSRRLQLPNKASLEAARLQVMPHPQSPSHLIVARRDSAET